VAVNYYTNQVNIVYVISHQHRSRRWVWCFIPMVICYGR